jgi:hypothetical protein
MEPLKVGDIVGLKGYVGGEAVLIDIKRGGRGDKGIVLRLESLSIGSFAIEGDTAPIYLENLEKRSVQLSLEQEAAIEKIKSEYFERSRAKTKEGGSRKTRHSKNRKTKHRRSKNKHRHTRRH